jgi:hypothetical protein
MIKSARLENVKDENLIQMKDMKPLQVGVMVNNGHIVMRTAGLDHFEVMNLSYPNEDACWVGNPNHYTHPVRLLPSGTKISIEVA